MKKLVFLILLILGIQEISGQDLNYRTICVERHDELKGWYDEGAYLLVKEWADLYLDRNICREQIRHDIELLRVLSTCYIALLSDADLRLAKFSIRHPHADNGTISSEHLAFEKFGNQDWEAALSWFERPHYFYSLEVHPDEWGLAHGYVLFQLGRYERAIHIWDDISTDISRYYFPSRYYTALAYVNQERLDKAIEMFRLIEDHPLYRDDVPYYLAQIYYEEKLYKEVVDITDGFGAQRPKHIDLYRLAGLSAYEIQRYDVASKYLDRYISASPTVEGEVYYLAGLSAYQNGAWPKANDRFKSISHQDNELGQLANYYLADIALRTGDKALARNAFAAAYRMDYLPEISEQSFFYYGKLSAELRYDRDAIVHLRDFEPTSLYYEEAQKIMSELLLSTRDYATALQTLATISNKGVKLQEAEQRIMLQLGLLYLSEGKEKEAEDILESTSLKQASPRTALISKFWLGELFYRQGELDKAKKYYNAFLNSADGDMTELKSQAHYSLGYIAMRTEKTDAAIRNFEKALALGLDDKKGPDTETRLGDLNLSINNYNRALEYYNSILSKYPQASRDYVLYQKAIIQGLKGEHVRKLVTLEKIIDEYRNSQYLDDALYESGVTLQMIDKPNDALTSFRFLLDEFEGVSPLVIPSLLRMALISYNQGDLKQSADYYRQVFDHQPDSKQRQEALTGLREIYVNDLTRPDVYLEIEAEFGSGQDQDIRRDSLTFAAAHRQYELGNFERAIEAFGAYLDGYKNGQFEILAHYERAVSALAVEDYQTALISFDSVCMHNPSRFSDACFKGAEIAYNYATDFQASSRLYERSIKYTDSPDEMNSALIGMLRSVHRTGDDSLQLEYAQKVLAIEKISLSEQVFAHYCLAKSRIANGEAEMAIDDLDFVIANSAGEMAAESRFLVARTYFRNDELTLAEKICDQANKMNVGHPYWVARGLILYSDILRASDDLYNARAALEAVITNAHDFPELVEIAQQKMNELDKQLNQENKLNDGAED